MGYKTEKEPVKRHNTPPRWYVLFGALSAAAVYLTSCSGGDTNPVKHEAAASAQTADFKGGCKPYLVYSQSVASPLGTLLWQKPDATSRNTPSPYQPNQVIAVNGWVEGTGPPEYPNNPAPWNRNVFFHLAYPAGNSSYDWVSFAGVRGSPPTAAYAAIGGSPPAPTPPNCEGTYIP